MTEHTHRFDRRHGGHHRGGRRGPRAGRGDVRAAILLQLEGQPLHGYQIIRQVEEQSGGLWRPSPGSVYPALQLLEDEGLIRAEEQDSRRVYSLTAAGRAEVSANRESLIAGRDAMAAQAGEGAHELHALMREVHAAVRQVARVGSPAQIDAARRVLNDTRRTLYLILAGDNSPATQPNQQGGDAHE